MCFGASILDPGWMPDSGAGQGSWNLELPKYITAAELEEIQYQALEKAQQQVGDIRGMLVPSIA